MFRLEVLDQNDNLLSTRRLDHGLHTIGQSPRAKIRIVGQDISGFHVALKLSPNQITVMDLGGRAKLRVNGRETLEEVIQSDSSLIEIGNQRLRLRKFEKKNISALKPSSNQSGANSKRFAREALTSLPQELRKPMAVSAALSLLLLILLAFLQPKANYEIEKNILPVYARVQEIPVEKIEEPEPQGGGGSGSTDQQTSAPKTSESLASGIRNLIGNVLSKSSSPTKIVVSNGELGQSIPTNQRNSANQNSLSSLGQNANSLAQATQLGKLAVQGSGKGFGGGSGTGLGASNGNQIGNGVGKGIGQGTFKTIDEESIVDGGLDKSVIAAVIQNNLSQIKYCYERQLIADPDLFGKVVVMWQIDAAGRVQQQKIKQTTLNSTPVEHCILSKISQWKFPNPKNGSTVNVTYPFLFKSTK